MTAMNKDQRVRLLVLIEDPALRDSTLALKDKVNHVVKPYTHSPKIRFEPEFLSSIEQLYQAIGKHVQNNPALPLCIIAENIDRAVEKRLKPPSYVIRQFVAATRTILTMVKVVPSRKACNKKFWDIVAPRDEFSEQSLRYLLRDISYNISLQLRPPRRTLGRQKKAVRVRIINSKLELKAALALRYKIYNKLGYIDKYNVGFSAGLDYDHYDRNSLHIGAYLEGSNNPIAYCRLIIESSGDLSYSTHQQTIADPLTAIRKEQTSWLAEIQDKISNSFLSPDTGQFRKLRSGRPFGSMPVIQSMQHSDEINDLFNQGFKFAELSRVVVDERFRGLGISTVLIRSAKILSKYINIDVVLLECTPQHVRLYQKYDFEEVDDAHISSAYGLGIPARVMIHRLSLPKTPTSQEGVKIDIDFKMWKDRSLAKLSSRGAVNAKDNCYKRYLCLCNHRECWNGYYNLHEQDFCPIS